MMLDPVRPKQFSKVPPKIPYKRSSFNFILSKCSIDSCPNTNTGFCSYCELHCEKYHKDHAKNNRIE